MQSRQREGIQPVSTAPEDAWLRGYFQDRRGDTKDGSDPWDGTWKKNVDFMRLRDVLLHHADLKPGQMVIDIGCGDGTGMVYCGLQGATVYGQEIDPQAVEQAKALLQRFEIEGEVKTGDAVQLKFPDNTFDVAISSDVFEHITDDIKLKALGEMLRVLKPGGLALIKTPNLGYLTLSLYYKRLGALCRLKNPLDIVIPHTPGTDDPEHIGLTTRWTFAKIVYEAGFLNYEFLYAPLRRFGYSSLIEVLSTEIPVVRDVLCEDLFCKAYKPIGLSHFPD